MNDNEPGPLAREWQGVLAEISGRDPTAIEAVRKVFYCGAFAVLRNAFDPMAMRRMRAEVRQMMKESECPVNIS